jgi:uncharacterized damage-inducible protein DinB
MTLAHVDIREQFRYSDRCRALLQEVLEANPDTFAREFATLSKWNSLQMLMAHCMGAEERWIENRIRGKYLPYVETAPPASLNAAFARWQQIRANTLAFMDGLEGEDWQRNIRVDLPQWSHTTQITVEQILFHIVNHENFHRGQMSMLLQHFGVDPPNFDYCLLLK